MRRVGSDVSDAQSTSNDPATIVAAMAAGDSGPALSAFYDDYASMVLGLLTKMLGSRAEAEEIMQEVFVELWHRAHEYDATRGVVIAWVTTIARSRALDALKARARRFDGGQLPLSGRHAFGTDGGRPDVLASATRWHRALRRSFDGLTADQRAVLELSYFAGMSHVQISELLNVPVGTVKSLILRGMRALRNMLPAVHQAMRD